MAKDGETAKEMLDATASNVFRKVKTSFVSEINMSEQARQISENILNNYSEMIESNKEILDIATMQTDDVADLMRAKQRIKLGEIHSKVYAMMIESVKDAGGTVTMQDLADNMEFIINNRFPRLRKLMTAQLFGESENSMMNLFFGAQNNRMLKALKKRNVTEELMDQYDDVVQGLRGVGVNMAQEHIDNFSSALATFARTRQLSVNKFITEDRGGLTMALELLEASKSDFSALRSIGLDDETEQYLRNIRMAGQARRSIEDYGVSELLEFGGRPSATGFVPETPQVLSQEDLDRLLGRTEDSTQARTEGSNVYRRFKDSLKDGRLGEAFKNPTVKRSAYAIAGLAAAGLIYSAAKDHTESDIAGPPLLPGGSAYEQLASRQPQIPQASMFSGYNPGTSYNINIEGSQDQVEQFNSAVGSVAGGSVNSTMYRGVPRLGRDPYSMLASSFG